MGFTRNSLGDAYHYNLASIHNPEHRDLFGNNSRWNGTQYLCLLESIIEKAELTCFLWASTGIATPIYLKLALLS